MDPSLVDVASISYHDLTARCCQYTFDLLVKYLHAANQMALLSLLNAHVAVTVTSGDPSPHEDEEDAAARTVITGKGPPSKTDAFNSATKGRWGILEDSIEVQFLDEREEEERRAREEKERAEAKAHGGGEGGEGGEGERPTPSKKKKVAPKEVGPARYCSPRHRMARKLRNERWNCVSMTWWAIFACPSREAEAAGDGKEVEVVPPPKLVHSEIPIPEHSYSTRLEALEVGPGRCCSPRHRMPFKSINEGSKYVLMTWRGLSGRP